VGALVIYFILNTLLPSLAANAESLANTVGLGSLNAHKGDWPGLYSEVQRLQFLLFGLILVLIMLLRPQGLFPSRVREQELTHAAVQEEASAVEEGVRA
jgi:branched-chain amino acid transport system permease protein